MMSAADFNLARNLMVDGQLRPNKVTDRRIIDAMRSLPRELFAPPNFASLAYIDEDLPLGHGRVMLKPLVIARLLQLARPRAGETALVVGSGTGYGAAILAACGVQVTALESVPSLVEMARHALTDLASISLVQGPLAEGHAAAAPYDLVVIEGAVPSIPPTIGRQVAAGGRLVTIIMENGVAGYAALAEPTTGGLRAQAAFDANAKLLPGLSPAKSFTF
jgi:protein-L-isoaspartate(D-aspartate) O-methyltransferase